jgi:hypothetical protein
VTADSVALLIAAGYGAAAAALLWLPVTGMLLYRARRAAEKETWNAARRFYTHTSR